jgi:hypothetical protein
MTDKIWSAWKQASTPEVDALFRKLVDEAAEMDYDIDPSDLGNLSFEAFKAGYCAALAAEMIDETEPDRASVEATKLEILMRLAHATGMPADGEPVSWLRNRGIIEKVGNGWRLTRSQSTVE